MITVLAIGVIGLVAVGGAVIGVRHLYLRADRPGGFDCSLRVVEGSVDGLSARFRAGYAGPELDRLRWRRIARPGPAVVLPPKGIVLDGARSPRAGERRSIPARFVIVPLDMDDRTRLELALSRRKFARLVDLLQHPPAGRPRR